MLNSTPSTWQALAIALAAMLLGSPLSDLPPAAVAVQDMQAPHDAPQPVVPDPDEPDAPPAEPDGAAPAEPQFDPDIIPVDDPELDALLDRLERSGDDLRNFTARIVYRKYDELLGRTETRTGNIIYVSEPVEGLPDATIRRFAILFDVLVVGNRRDDRQKHYIFDGRWLAEVDDANRHFHAREIVPPGRVLDPLKLGEGPFPLPFGQKKREVLKRFIVDWTAIPPAGMLSKLDNVHGIVLLPRTGTDESAEFLRVEVFYDRDTLLPVGVEAVHKNGDTKTVLLKDVVRNASLDADTLAKVTIVRPQDDDWAVTIEEWTGQD